jgi:hypothetical protein
MTKRKREEDKSQNEPPNTRDLTEREIAPVTRPVLTDLPLLVLRRVLLGLSPMAIFSLSHTCTFFADLIFRSRLLDQETFQRIYGKERLPLLHLRGPRTDWYTPRLLVRSFLLRPEEILRLPAYKGQCYIHDIVTLMRLLGSEYEARQARVRRHQARRSAEVDRYLEPLKIARKDVPELREYVMGRRGELKTLTGPQALHRRINDLQDELILHSFAKALRCRHPRRTARTVIALKPRANLTCKLAMVLDRGREDFAAHMKYKERMTFYQRVGQITFDFPIRRDNAAEAAAIIYGTWASVV